jgi:hypothetical protein
MPLRVGLWQGRCERLGGWGVDRQIDAGASEGGGGSVGCALEPLDLALARVDLGREGL